MSTQIYISLNESTYEGGSQVNGSIMMMVYKTIDVHSLKLKFSGEEDVNFTVIQFHSVPDPNGMKDDRGEVFTVSERVPKNYNQRRGFYAAEHIVQRFPGGIVEPGQYQFPFSFVLGSNVPNSFHHLWTTEEFQNHARILYTLKAILVNQLDKPIEKESIKYLIVQNKKRQELDAPRRIDQTFDVSINCCQPAGRTKMVTYFEKDSYLHDDDVFIVCEIDNYAGKTDVCSVKATFHQELRVKAGNKTETSRSVVQGKELKVSIPAGQGMTGNNSIRLQIPLRSDSKISTTVQGELIKCLHSITVTCTMEGCCATSPANTIRVTLFDKSNVDPLPPGFASQDSQPTIYKPTSFTPQYMNVKEEDSLMTDRSLNYPTLD